MESSTRASGRVSQPTRVLPQRPFTASAHPSLLGPSERLPPITAVDTRVLSPFVKRVAIANPLHVKAIAHAHVKTDKVDAGTLASLYAAGYLPEIWTPDSATERLRRLVARRYQVVRHRTRLKNEVHAILHAHLIPKCPHSDLGSPNSSRYRPQ